MAEKRVYKRYFTKEKKEKVNSKSVKIYDQYLKSNIIKNKEVEKTTYKVYEGNFYQLLVYIYEEWDDVYILSDEFLENAVDILEGFIVFCQDVLGNKKKAINNKIASISSFFLWCVKRGKIEKHPFENKLDRMKGAKEEKLINHYYLDNKQIDAITKTLHEEYEKGKSGKFDIQDLLIWHIALDSANRAGALSKLVWSKLDLENMLFTDIREKLGYRVEVPFNHEAKDLLIKWKEMRKDMDNLECDNIFVVKYNGEYREMSQTAIYMRVRKMGTIIGLDDFHPHCIRKSTLNRIVEETGDITLAQELANHKSLETTASHYVKPKSKADVGERLNKLMKKD